MARHATPAQSSGEKIFQDLYTRIFALGHVEPHQILGVTSAVDGEGKTMIATYLAIARVRDLLRTKEAHAEPDVLIVSCRQQEDPLRDELMIDSYPGMIQYLSGICSLEDAARPTLVPGLAIAPLGGSQDDFSALIRTVDLTIVKQQLSERYQLTVLDLPSLLVTSNARVLIECADKVVMVVRGGVTTEQAFTDAIEEIDPDKFIGSILNHYRRDLPNWLDQWL